MKEILCREVPRRQAIQIETLPWILKAYRYPFDRWSTVGRQGLFGVHNFLLYYLYKQLYPFKIYGTFSYTLNGQKQQIRFNPKNATFHILYFKAYALGYEPQVSALFDLITPAKGVFFDIGSNWGWFTLMLASRPGFEGRINAFEPFPSTFADLSSMVGQAGITDRVRCHNLALLDRTGPVSMYLPDHIHSGCATVAPDGKGGNPSIQTSTLDSFSAEPPDVMKVDVEGTELQVFKGGRELLKKHTPMIVFENKRDKDDISQTMQPILLLEQLGYVFYHPAWLRKVGQSPALVGDDLDPVPQPKEVLALVPFQSGERLLKHDTMNIFACHKDKVQTLKSLFETRLI